MLSESLALLVREIWMEKMGRLVGCLKSEPHTPSSRSFRITQPSWGLPLKLPTIHEFGSRTTNGRHWQHTLSSWRKSQSWTGRASRVLKLPTPSLLFAYNYVVFLPLFFKSAPRSFQDSCFEMFASVAHHAMHPFRVGKCGSTRTSKRPASCASSCRNNSAASSASPDLGLAALDQLGETIPKFGSRSLIFSAKLGNLS